MVATSPEKRTICDKVKMLAVEAAAVSHDQAAGGRAGGSDSAEEEEGNQSAAVAVSSKLHFSCRVEGKGGVAWD